MNTEIQKVLKSVNVTSAAEINETVLMRLNKNPLAKFVESLVNVIGKNVDLCKAAAGKIDQLKTEKIADQKLLLKFQQGEAKSVQETVKSEMKSWADIVKKDTNQRKQLTEHSVKQAVRTVNEEERRSKNLMIYGCAEDNSKDIGMIVKDVYQAMGYPLPNTIDCYRVGKEELGKPRPIKVELTNAGDVQFALVHARKLKTSNLSAVYLGPDRTRDERLAHSKLVKEMKELIKKDPNTNRHYFIRNNKICSADKALSPP